MACGSAVARSSPVTCTRSAALVSLRCTQHAPPYRALAASLREAAHFNTVAAPQHTLDRPGPHTALSQASSPRMRGESHGARSSVSGDGASWRVAER